MKTIETDDTIFHVGKLEKKVVHVTDKAFEVAEYLLGKGFQPYLVRQALQSLYPDYADASNAVEAARAAKKNTKQEAYGHEVKLRKRRLRNREIWKCIDLKEGEPNPVGVKALRGNLGAAIIWLDPGLSYDGWTTDFMSNPEVTE